MNSSTMFACVTVSLAIATPTRASFAQGGHGPQTAKPATSTAAAAAGAPPVLPPSRDPKAVKLTLDDLRECKRIRALDLTSARCTEPEVAKFCDDAKSDPANAVASDCVRLALSSTRPAFGSAAKANSGSTAELDVASTVTSFLIARAAQETLLFLRDKLAKDLCGSGDTSRALLPLTCTVLVPSGDSARIDQLSALPQAFRSDLDELPIRIVDFSFGASEEDIACLTRISARTLGPIRRGTFPLDALRDVISATNLHCSTTTKVALERNILLADALVKELAQARVGAKGGPPEPRVVTNQILAVVRDQFSASPTEIRLLQELLQRIRPVVRAWPDEASQADPRVVAELLSAGTLLVGAILGTVLPPDSEAQHSFAAFTDAYASFSRRQYTSAALKLFSSPVVRDVLANATLSTDKLHVLRNVERNIQLLAAVADAKSPDDVNKILEASAAPLNSWREYRRRPHAGFISAHLGFGGGYEVPVSDRATSGAIVSPLVPVGVEVGWPLWDSSSLNLLLSPIDLGSIASARLNKAHGGEKGSNGNAAIAPNFRFQSLVTPGVAIAIGLDDSPFVLGAVVQYATANRDFFTCSSVCSETETIGTFRSQIYLGVDLPVLPIF